MVRPPFLAYVLPWAAGPSKPRPVTTLAVGEEAGTPRPPPERPLTSLSVGEESGAPR